MLGTASTPARRTIVTFHEGLAWVAQLGLFLMLGLLVFPSELVDIIPEGTAIAIVTAALSRGRWPPSVRRLRLRSAASG